MWRSVAIFSERARKGPVLIGCMAVIAIIAIADWLTPPFISLGFLYLLPIASMAGFLPRTAIVALGVGCAALSELFSSFYPAGRVNRSIFEMLLLVGCGLFFSELLRNRRLRLEGERKLQVLVDTSPVAIVTVDHRGVVEMANHAAEDLLRPESASLVGQPIGRFLPELSEALVPHGDVIQFQTSIQCHGRRGTGETFPAEVCFSTFQEGNAPKLAALIADVSLAPAFGRAASRSGEVGFSSRQVAVLRLLYEGLSNREIAARLHISASGVKNTLHQVFSKAGVSNRSQMIRVLLEQHPGLL